MQSNEILELYNNAAKVTKCCATQRNAFRYWLSHNKKAPEQSLSWDSETTGISFGVPSMLHIGKTDIKVYNIKVFGISLAIPAKKRIVLIWARIGTDLFDETVKLLGMPGQKTAHNARYDLRVCRLKVNKIKIANETHCSMNASRIFWDRRLKHGLQPLCEMICPELSDWEIPVKNESRRIKARYTRSGHPKGYSNYSFIPDELMSIYSMTDSFLGLIVHSMLHPRMLDTYNEAYTREMKILSLALKMEQNSLQYDCRKSLTEELYINKKAVKLEHAIYKIVDTEFNIKSPAQVVDMLMKLNIPIELITTKEGKLSTDKTLLEPIIDDKLWDSKEGSRFIKTLLNIKALYKTINSYLAPYRKRALYNNGKLFCNINSADTRTGRMAVKDPALQTLPRLVSRRKRKSPVRSCFICKPGYWNYHFDFKQIEMIFYAVLIGDQRIIDVYTAGNDIYTEIAKYAVSKKNLEWIRENLGDPRQVLKQLSLAIIYGSGVPGVARLLNSRRIAESVLIYYLDACPLVVQYREQCKHELYTKGYVEDFFGKRYHIETGQAYKAPNAVVQGSCAQILKIAALQVDDYLCDTSERLKSRLILPVHDELIIERLYKHEETERRFVKNVVHNMYKIKQLTSRGLKLTIEVARTKTNWAAKKELTF